MSSSISNSNLDNAILDATIDKENLTYISNFGLSSSVAQYIDSCLIFNNIHINELIITSDMELNS